MIEVVFKIGPLTSFASLQYHFSKNIRELRRIYVAGETPKVIYDLSQLEYKAISMGGLTALLAISYRIRQYTERPIYLDFSWDPHVQGFLADISFFTISRRFDLFYWDERMVGGFESGTTNPNSKLLFYADVNPQSIFSSKPELDDFKRILKQKISPNFLLRCANIFSGFGDKIVGIVSNTTLELIVNSLIHGESIAFVGLQRTSKRITVAVSDYGVGFPKSLNRTFFKESPNKMSHMEGIVIGTLIQQKAHGLRLAISETLSCPIGENTGKTPWVVISSYDSGIRFEQENWSKIIENSQILENPSVLKKLSKELPGFTSFSDSLIGTRIAFEIPLK